VLTYIAPVPRLPPLKALPRPMAPLWGRLMTADTQPKPSHVQTPKGARFAPGHGGFARKGPTIRDQRRQQARVLARMIADMASAVDRGEPVDPNAFTRLIGLQMRLERDL
jgi:hypothetical protein